MFLNFFDTEYNQEIKKKFFKGLDKTKSLEQVVDSALECSVKLLAKIGTRFISEVFDIQERLRVVFKDRLKAGSKHLPLIHPFKPPSYSLSSLSLAIWELFSLEDDVLYSLPPRQKVDKSSYIERHWASLHAKAEDPDGETVLHTATSEIYQKRFVTDEGKCYPDYYNPSSKSVAFFNGCRFHSCEICKQNYDGGKDGIDETIQKIRKIQQFFPGEVSNNFEIARECGWRDFMKKEGLTLVKIPGDRLQSRSAYRSGFTELLTNFYIADDGTICELWDISSLYGYIGKIERFFTGQFITLTERSIEKLVTVTKDNQIMLEDKEFHGFLYAKIVPPKDLDLPFLGIKMNLNKEATGSKEDSHEKEYHSKPWGKTWRKKSLPDEHLVHTLCKSCAMNQSEKECKHSDEERAILSVVSSDEAKYMISIGYKIPKQFIYEMWAFQESEKRPIFRDYMSFMEIEKIKNSPMPANMEPEEYVEAVNKELGLTGEKALTRQDFRANPVKRATIKQLCNGLFGRLGMRPRNASSKFFKNQEELENFRDKMHLVEDVQLHNNNVLELILDSSQIVNNRVNRRTNVLVASQVFYILFGRNFSTKSGHP